MFSGWLNFLVYFSINLVHSSFPHSLSFQDGECTFYFPSLPSHHQQVISTADSQKSLQYDAFTAKLKSEGRLFLFVVKYPKQIQLSEKSPVYEGILRSFMSQHPNSQMVYIKKIPNFHEGIEFLMESSHTFYQGRAFIIDNHVYFIIMECRSVREQQKLFTEIMNKIRVR